MKAAGLRQIALAHLQRFPCSVNRLREVLKRKIVRSVKAYGDDQAELLDAAEQAIASLDGGAFLDDRRFAVAVAGSQHRRGKSLRAIRQKLRMKGLKQDDIDAAIAAINQSVANPDLDAARSYARRRRLGPFQRDAARRKERHQKDLAALARQGFSYSIAKQIIDAPTPEALEALIEGEPEI